MKKNLSKTGYVVTFFIFSLIELMTISDFLTDLRSASWPTVPGVVVSSEIKTFVEYRKMLYMPEIAYRYKVAGKDFTSTKVRASGVDTVSESEAEKIMTKFHLGAEVDVYYNPENPSESYLHAGLDYGSYILVFGPLVSYIIFLVFIARGNEKQSDNETR